MYKRKATIVFLLAMLTISLGFCYVLARPFLEPLAFAVVLAIACHPLFLRLQKHTKTTTQAALLATLLVFILFVVPLIFLLFAASGQAIGVAQSFGHRSAQEGGMMAFVLKFLERPLAWIGRYVDLSKFDLRSEIITHLNSAGKYLLGLGAALLGNLAGFVVNAIITFFTLFFFFREGGKIVRRIISLLPLSEKQSEKILQGISDTVIGNVYGIVAVGAAQGLLTGIATKIVGMHSSILLGLAAGICSVIPIVGASIVWFPIAVFLLFTGHLWKGIFLLLWGTVLVATVDNIIRPLVVGGKVELHPVLLLFALIGGAQAFGFLGLFLGPVILSITTALIEILLHEMYDEPLPQTEEVRTG
ncbi:MAG TPA: AI-2E family transporter [Terriglobales bacterium]|nr:AI-2E family transporter [Terriglobales bacterium]